MNEPYLQHLFIMKHFCACIFPILISLCSLAQSTPILEKLIEQSNCYYAANKATAFRTLATEAQTNVIKNQVKPQLQAAYQLNYATYNNITGMVFPSFITPISGPPATSNSYRGVFGSAAALLAKWDIATFGYQKSLLEQATTQTHLSKAQELLQEFRQNVQLSSTYLDWLLANKLITVYRNNLSRVGIALELSQALTQKGLRPGTDSASWSSEYSKARVLLEQQQKSTNTLFIQLKQLIGKDTVFTATDTVFLSKLPDLLEDSSASQHPELQVLQLQIENQKSGIKVLQQSKKPLLSLYGTGYARGSGVEADNDIKTFQGLSFQRYNYGIGAQLSVPLFEASRTKVKVQQQQQLVNAAAADYQLMQWQLQKEIEEADTTLQRAINIVSLTQSQQQSANFLFNAVTARYKAGLVSYADVVLAQQQLIQAEADVEKSKWEVWKSVLYKASVLGDLKPFIEQFGK
jgi:outer membrane protein